MDFSFEQMGKRIADRRIKLNIKQNELAEKVGISNNHMSNIERGKENPSISVFIDICNSLQVTPDYLLMGSMHPKLVPQNIVDSLQLCLPDDIEMLSVLVEFLVKKRSHEWNNDNFI